MEIEQEFEYTDPAPDGVTAQLIPSWTDYICRSCGSAFTIHHDWRDSVAYATDKGEKQE